jgi:hypothetical protein
MLSDTFRASTMWRDKVAQLSHGLARRRYAPSTLKVGRDLSI